MTCDGLSGSMPEILEIAAWFHFGKIVSGSARY